MSLMEGFINQAEQVSLFIPVGDQIDTVDTVQFLMCPPGVAAGSHYQGVWALAVGLC
jgi:hypothetical protein